MSEKTITVIPKKPDIPIDLVTGKIRKLKVCGYARVSTDFEDQKNSFDFQKREFEERIKQNPEWEFVDMYSDEGISGTNTTKRKGFLSMIKDAEHGKIDLILIKSLSRFARNTVDCLSYIRKLANIGVSVYFEKENITTTKDNVDLVLTIHAAIAEAESRDISESVKWGVRKRMQKGEKKTPAGKTLGYSSDANGNWYITEEQELVQTIFTMFINGFSFNQIINRLEELDKEKFNNAERKWHRNKIIRILRNEKYKGTIIYQKTVTIDVLTHKRVINDGIEPKYVVDNHHPAIIDSDTFDYVQMILDSQKSNWFDETIVKSNQTPLSGLLICEECERTLRRIKYPYNNEYVLTCKNRNKCGENYYDCKSDVLPYNLVESAVINFLNNFNIYKNNSCNELIEHLLNIMDETDFVSKYKDLEKKKINLEAKIDGLIKEQAKISETSSSFSSEFLGLKEQIKIINSELKKLKQLAKDTYDLKGKRKDLMDLLDGYSSNNISLIRNLVSFVIHRKDGSLRFVLCPNNPRKTKYAKAKQQVLNATPIYKSFVVNNNNKLAFDVVSL